MRTRSLRSDAPAAERAVDSGAQCTPDGAMRKLLGLMSRCRTQLSWQKARPWSTIRRYAFTSAALKVRDRSLMTSSRSVSQYSNTCGPGGRRTFRACCVT